MLSNVVLPQPEWPMIETYSPFSTVQIDVLEHFALLRAAAEDLVDVIDLEIGQVSPNAP